MVPFTGPIMNGVQEDTLDEFDITTTDLSTARVPHKYNYIITNKLQRPSMKKLLKAKVVSKPEI